MSRILLIHSQLISLNYFLCPYWVCCVHTGIIVFKYWVYCDDLPCFLHNWSSWHSHKSSVLDRKRKLNKCTESLLSTVACCFWIFLCNNKLYNSWPPKICRPQPNHRTIGGTKEIIVIHCRNLNPKGGNRASIKIEEIIIKGYTWAYTVDKITKQEGACWR